MEFFAAYAEYKCMLENSAVGHLPFTGAIIYQGAKSRTLSERDMTPMVQ